MTATFNIGLNTIMYYNMATSLRGQRVEYSGWNNNSVEVELMFECLLTTEWHFLKGLERLWSLVLWKGVCGLWIQLIFFVFQNFYRIALVIISLHSNKKVTNAYVYKRSFMMFSWKKITEEQRSKISKEKSETKTVFQNLST